MNTGNETQLLVRLLNASSMRAKVIAGNLANQNTPGYVRRDVRFESLLREAMDDNEDSTGEIRPEIFEDLDSPFRPDGNNVSLETEMNAMRENRLMYETYAAILSGSFELLRASIQER